MDLLIVPSEHSKTGFVQSLYEQMKKLPDGGMQKLGELKLEKPIEVLFEGADEDIYKPIENASLDLVDDIKEDFAFLSVGQWGNAPFGEDRKDIGTLVKLFYEAFANKKNIPALILKTNGATYSILDREDCLLKLNMIKKQFPSDWKLPNVYLLHGDFTDVEMNKLYNHPKIKSFVTFTHGEGFGRPLLEASMTGLPIIAPAWGGQVDFLNSEQSLIVPGEVREVPKSAVWENIIIPESKWYYVDNNLGYKALTLMFENIEEYQQKAKKQQSNNSNLYTLNKMTKKLSGIMKKYTNNISSQVELKLPKLKKVKETI
jgi:glycosyltransferase involved in cell wall biosynthesis